MTTTEFGRLFDQKNRPHGRDLGGTWYSAFQPNSAIHDRWHPEQMVIATQPSGAFVCESKDYHRTFHWVASGTIYKGNAVSGIWASKKKARDAAGTFILSVDTDGRKLLGFLLGEADEDRKANYGAWVLARSRGGVEEGKRWLARLCPTLLDLWSLLPPQLSRDPPPDFAPLVGNPALRGLLERRWDETVKCISIGSHLAAVVMMGGLLETLLLARVEREKERRKSLSAIFKTAAAKTFAGNHRFECKDWTLKHFIPVAHELGWITQGAKDVGKVLQEYRNYIHPGKERNCRPLKAGDVDLFWKVAKSITKQLVQKA